MILTALKYTRYVDEPREWSIIGRNNDYAYFGNMNLLVGKNASGKSRTLNVIREIAKLLSGQIDLDKVFAHSQRFELIFSDNSDRYQYILFFKNRKVLEETLHHNGKLLFDRNMKILLNKNNENINFSVQENELAVITQDKNGNPYFEKLVMWGHSLKNYYFVNQVEKNRLVKDYTQVEYEVDPDIEDPEVLIYTFHKGKEKFGNLFIDDIVKSMQDLGYNITDVDIEKTRKGYYGLCVEENGEYSVSQRDMSQGMFRSLSLFIMLDYARLKDMSFCLLIDDMGEGLDFERSKKMMDLVIKKVNKSNMQFFMTSNERHIMNQISLRYWSVIGREHNKSVFYDYINSKEIFEDFKYTGLNNFDFLATDFYYKGFGIIDEDND